jgi:hypothetical protein
VVLEEVHQKTALPVVSCRGHLRWSIETIQFTLILTERRLQRLLQLLQGLPRSKSREFIKTWHKVLVGLHFNYRLDLSKNVANV